MIVTIFTDASFCHSTGAAGWGAWVKSDRGCTFAGNSMKELVKDAEMAEMMAVVNGVALARAHGVAVVGDHLVIECDSQDAILSLSASRTVISPSKRVVLSRFQLEIAGFTFKFKWVKGHQRNWSGNPRAAVNRLVDKMAGNHMRRHREEITGKPQPKKRPPGRGLRQIASRHEAQEDHDQEVEREG